jgi:hypothetical protein
MNVEAVVAWGGTECSLAGCGESKGGRCYQSGSLQLQRLRLDRLFTSCCGFMQFSNKTDLGKEHTLSTSYKTLDRPISPEPVRLLL